MPTARTVQPVHPVLPAQPQLRGDAVLLSSRPDGLQIALSARQVVTIRHAPPAVAQWLAALDGTVGLAEAAAAAPLDREEALFLLGELDRAGLLFDADAGRVFSRSGAEQPDALALCHQTRAGQPRRSLAPGSRRTVEVSGPDPWARQLAGALDLPGITVRSPGAGADLMVILGHPFDPALERAAGRAMAVGAAHVVVTVSAADAVLLPATVPGRTACLRCWGLQHDRRWPDWADWAYRGRRIDPPRLPTHQRALLLGLVVEHILLALPVLHDDPRPEAATAERYLDLRRGSVQLRPVAAHPACGCVGVQRAAAPDLPIHAA